MDLAIAIVGTFSMARLLPCCSSPSTLAAGMGRVHTFENPTACITYVQHIYASQMSAHILRVCVCVCVCGVCVLCVCIHISYKYSRQAHGD
jgi:hypothetical protein